VGAITLCRELRGGQDLLFAWADNRPVWAQDQSTGQQWWYVASHLQEWQQLITQAMQACPTPLPTAAAADLSLDLAQRRPGHELLAEIEQRHAAASKPSPDGLPGALDPEIAHWCVGYVGEETVAATLTALPSPWRVLHSVPTGNNGKDIDHVLVGPAGIFTMNTKHHPGGTVDVKEDAVFLGPTFQPYLSKSRSEARGAQEVLDRLHLPGRVSAILCVVDARLRMKQPPAGVHVTDERQLVSWLLTQPALLAPAQVDHVFQALRDLRAWTNAPVTPTASPWVADFARQIATEHTIAKAAARQQQAPGQRSRGPVSPTRPRTRRPASSRPTRPGSRPSAAGVLLLAALAVAAMLVLPALAQALSAAFRQGTQHLTPTTHPVAGSSCTSLGATAADPLGRQLVCSRPKLGGQLTWANAQ
jgi:hypothetical protein